MNANTIKTTLVAALLAAAGLGAWVVSPRDDEDEARARVEREVLDQTIAILERRYESDPYNYLVADRLVDSYLRRFRSEAGQEDLARAEKIAGATLRIAPDRSTASARLSLVQLTRHAVPGAFRAARAAVAADSSNSAALAALFDASLEVGEYDLAEATLRRLPPTTLAFRLRRARWLAAHGHLDGAREIMLAACRRLYRSAGPRDWVAWCLTQLAEIDHQRLGADGGVVWLDLALRIRPDHRAALEGLADRAYGRGRWREAETLYRRIVSEGHPDVYLRLAEVLSELGRVEEAAGYEERFLRLAGAPAARALYARPLALFHAERETGRDLALEIALGEVERRPSVGGYDVLSWVYLARGELASALEASDRARVWGDPSPTMDYHRARILEALGRAGEAAALLAQAVSEPTLLEPHVQRDLRRRTSRPLTETGVLPLIESC